MSRSLPVVICAALLAGSCSRPPDERRFPLHGQVQKLEPQRKLITVKHDDIKGFMPAMTMPYDVLDAKVLDGLAPGDVIDATLVVMPGGAHLADIKKVGSAPLEKAPPEAPNPSASSGFELLKPGEAIPDTDFLDQDGRKRHFGEFQGAPLVVTFIYTKCPLPTFCPLMDRHFASMQKPLHDDPTLKDVRLVTISFDPATDTPPVLKAHAKTLNADLSRWTFLTGSRDDVDKFAARFGVSVGRAMNDPRDITHNLRTAIVGADGTLVKVFTGNDWTPAQILADLRQLKPSA